MTFQKGQNWNDYEPVPPRLEKFSIPEPNTGCHLWLGALSTDGYAQLWAKGRQRSAHILAYELARGLIPQGFQIDHLCRMRCCVNPAHLEAVTPQTNSLRGLGPFTFRERNAAAYSLTCPRGHTGVVRYLRKDGRLQKQCPTCRKEKWHAKGT